MTTRWKSLRSLDQVQHLAQLETFAPAPFLASLAAELAEPPSRTVDELGLVLDAPLDVLDELDRFAQKSMGIHLTHVLADTPLPPQLRTVFMTTLLSYERNLPQLRGRVASSLARLPRDVAAGITDRIMDAAQRVLGVRAGLRTGLLEIARGLAGARLPAVLPAAQDRKLPDEQRRRWAQARIDLEQLAAQPETLLSGRFAERLQRITPPPDEPAPEVSRFSLLEID